MAIQLASFKVEQEGERKVREFINTPQGQIEVYEPTVADADAILELQREMGMNFGDERISFNASVVLKRLFPLLTNIETADLTDEEVDEISENPSIHLLIAQNYVSQIVSEVNKLYAQRIKTELASVDSIMSQAELVASIPQLILEKAKSNPQTSELVTQIEAKTKELEEAIEKEANGETV